MKIEQIKSVMRKYGKTWEKRDANLILECFAKNGVCQDMPLKKPFKGRKEIKKYWDFSVIKSVRGAKFTLGKCYVSSDENIGFAEWKCRSPKDGKWRKAQWLG